MEEVSLEDRLKALNLGDNLNVLRLMLEARGRQQVYRSVWGDPVNEEVNFLLNGREIRPTGKGFEGDYYCREARKVTVSSKLGANIRSLYNAAILVSPDFQIVPTTYQVQQGETLLLLDLEEPMVTRELDQLAPPGGSLIVT